MVGQPRSKGCRICVQRRIRCDLTRPVCLRCRKGNRQCPGYPSDFQFQDETAKLHQQFGQNSWTHNGNENREDSPAPAEGHPSTPSRLPFMPARPAITQRVPLLQPMGTVVAITDGKADSSQVLTSDLAEETEIPIRPYLHEFEGLFSACLHSPDIQQRQLFSLFKSSVAPFPQKSPIVFRRHGDWFNQLSTMQGLDPLLDTAFRAVSLAHLSLIHQKPHLMHESRKLYGQSLGLLSKALTDPRQGRSTETLSATIMLSFYEMFSSNHETSNGYDAWVRHAGGAGALMQARGPSAHRHGLDQSMFIAYRNALVIEAFETRKPCFLNEPEWRQLAFDIHVDSRQSLSLGNGLEILDLSEALINEIIQLPGTLSDALDLASLTRAAARFRDGNKKMKEIGCRARRHRTVLTKIYLDLDHALQRTHQEKKLAPSHTGDRLFPLVYKYPNIFIAVHYVGYWNVLIIMNIILIALDDDGETAKEEHVVENAEAARNICRSVEDMSTSSFLGPFYLTFALRTGVHALPTREEKDWTTGKLLEVGKKLGMANQPMSTGESLFEGLRREI